MPLTLEPIHTVPRTQCVARPSAERVDCPVCEKTFAGGSIVNHPIEHDEQHMCDAMSRVLYCDGCNHLKMWREAVDHLGRPTGIVLEESEPITKQSEINRFLKSHPEAKGVEQQ